MVRPASVWEEIKRRGGIMPFHHETFDSLRNSSSQQLAFASLDIELYENVLRSSTQAASVVTATSIPSVAPAGIGRTFSRKSCPASTVKFRSSGSSAITGIFGATLCRNQQNQTFDTILLLFQPHSLAFLAASQIGPNSHRERFRKIRTSSKPISRNLRTISSRFMPISWVPSNRATR